MHSCWSTTRLHAKAAADRAQAEVVVGDEDEDGNTTHPSRIIYSSKLHCTSSVLEYTSASYQLMKPYQLSAYGRMC